MEFDATEVEPIDGFPAFELSAEGVREIVNLAVWAKQRAESIDRNTHKLGVHVSGKVVQEMADMSGSLLRGALEIGPILDKVAPLVEGWCWGDVIDRMAASESAEETSGQ